MNIMNIKNKNLLINKCYVNGTWVSSDKKIKVTGSNIDKIKYLFSEDQARYLIA